jgi:hypothetical protein
MELDNIGPIHSIFFYMAIKKGPHIICKFSVIWTLQLPTRVVIF